MAFVSSYRNLTVSADETNRQLHLADFTVNLLGAPRSVAAQIEEIPGVAAVEGRLIVDTGLDLSEEKQATARVIGIPAGRHPAVNDILVEQGEYPASTQAQAGDSAAAGPPRPWSTGSSPRTRDGGGRLADWSGTPPGSRSS